MAKYTIRVQRSITQMGKFEVEAESEDEAWIKALCVGDELDAAWYEDLPALYEKHMIWWDKNDPDSAHDHEVVDMQ